MSEAIDQMRTRLCWQVPEEENKTIKENRDRRKAAKNRKARVAVGTGNLVECPTVEPCRGYGKRQTHSTQVRI